MSISKKGTKEKKIKEIPKKIKKATEIKKKKRKKLIQYQKENKIKNKRDSPCTTGTFIPYFHSESPMSGPLFAIISILVGCCISEISKIPRGIL